MDPRPRGASTQRYRVHHPGLTKPRMSLWKTDTFDSDIVPNELHWAAEKGNINLLAHLLMQNHDVNATDSFGRTALHEAAENNELQAADWLMCDGANSHAKDYESSTPMSLCKSEEMTRILSQNSSGKKPGILILMEETTYHVDDLDIRVITGPTFGPSPTYMMCRRLPPSRSLLRSTILKGERFWRDVIEYKISRINGWTEATVDVLVADIPPSSSELFLKVADGDGKVRDLKPKIDKFKVKETTCWLCKVRIKLDFFGSFVLCCRPKAEVIPIPRSGGHIVSQSNSSVQLNVPPRAFQKPGNVLFTIEEVPELEKEDNILSMSHFFKMEHTTCSDAQKDFEVTLPIPEGYTGSGDVVVLSRPSSSAASEAEGGTEEEDIWEVKEATIEPGDDFISFTTNRMGVNSPIEVQKGTNREELRLQSARIYSKRKECHVKFLVVGKILGFNQFDLVVECVKSDQIYLRIQDWKEENYTRLRLSGDFLSNQNQKYRLELQGNIQCLYGLNDLHLEFLPGQMSHQSLLVKVLNTKEAPNGTVAVHELSNNGVRLVTRLPILLEEQLGMSTQVHPEPQRKEKPNKGKQKSRIPRRINSFPGYSSQQYTSPRQDLEEDIGQREHVGRGSFSNESNVDDSEQELPAYSRALSTRTGHPTPSSDSVDQSESRRNPRGIPTHQQSGAASTRGRRVVGSRRYSDVSRDCLPAGVGESVTVGGAAAGGEVSGVNRHSRESSGVSIPVSQHEFVPSTLQLHTSNIAPASDDPSLHQAEQGLSAPISDNFFVHLVERMHPNFLVFVKLGLSNAEIRKIQRDTVNMDTDYTMFEMLIQCRQKRGDNAAFLHTLLMTLEESNENETKQWIVDWIKKWLQYSRTENQGFAKKIRPLVRRFDDNG